LEKYEKNLQANSSIIDVIIKAIAKNSKCNNDEASEALLLAIYHKYEDSFLSAAVRQGAANGFLPKVMDEVSVEAMLNEAGVNWTNARVIFRHLKQFFGRSVAVSERKRHGTMIIHLKWAAKYYQTKLLLRIGGNSLTFC
jgi:hypothetical protein